LKGIQPNPVLTQGGKGRIEYKQARSKGKCKERAFIFDFRKERWVRMALVDTKVEVQY
jgi:hypothetical protein